MILLLVLAGTAIYFLYKFLSPDLPANFPPGPKNYPIVGAVPNIVKLDKTLHVALLKIGDTYGPIAGCFFGRRRSVIINGPKAVREILHSEAFNGRPIVINGFRAEVLGIMFIEGEMWRVQRRWTMRHLRDWGFGKVSLESLIHDEIQECIRQVRKKVEAGVNGVIPVHNLFNTSMVNILWAVMAGKRYSHDDPQLQDILARINQVFRSGTPLGRLVDDYPFLRHFPIIGRHWKQNQDAQEAMNSLIKASISSHQLTRDRDNPRDFIDEYLHEVEDTPEGKPADPSFTMNQLLHICMDLFTAGAESTGNSIAFAILYSMLYPEVQKKARVEIDELVGKSRLMSYSDRLRLPYVEAVLAEVQRVANIAPLTVPHSNMEVAKFEGYTIPKNTMININLYSVHMSKELWGDPENFRPERFLDSDGHFQKSENLIPFGIGKRACPGESLARMNLTLFFASLLQHFDFSVVKDEPLPSTVPLPGFTIAPQPFMAKVTPL